MHRSSAAPRHRVVTEADHPRPPRRTSWLTAITLVFLLAGGIAADQRPLSRAAAPALTKKPAVARKTPPVARLCGQAGWPEKPVDGGAYIVQNDEWHSTAAECVTTDGHAQFAVASSSIYEPAIGAPGGYPSIFSGCSAGACTIGNKMPIRVSRLKPGTITSSWATTQTPGGAYNVAYDMWFNHTPDTSGAPDGGELMIWLAHRGGSQISPAGAPVAQVTIDGFAFTLWIWSGTPHKGPAVNRISYVMNRPALSVRDLDISGITADAASRGYLATTSYLLNIQAGFEIWQGGSGLSTKSFTVTIGADRSGRKPRGAPEGWSRMLRRTA